MAHRCRCVFDVKNYHVGFENWSFRLAKRLKPQWRINPLNWLGLRTYKILLWVSNLEVGWLDLYCSGGPKQAISLPVSAFPSAVWRITIMNFSKLFLIMHMKCSDRLEVLFRAVITIATITTMINIIVIVIIFFQVWATGFSIQCPLVFLWRPFPGLLGDSRSSELCNSTGGVSRNMDDAPWDSQISG